MYIMVQVEIWLLNILANTFARNFKLDAQLKEVN